MTDREILEKTLQNSKKILGSLDCEVVGILGEVLELVEKDSHLKRKLLGAKSSTEKEKFEFFSKTLKSLSQKVTLTSSFDLKTLSVTLKTIDQPYMTFGVTGNKKKESNTKEDFIRENAPEFVRDFFKKVAKKAYPDYPIVNGVYGGNPDGSSDYTNNPEKIDSALYPISIELSVSEWERLFSFMHSIDSNLLYRPLRTILYGFFDRWFETVKEKEFEL